MFKWGRGPLNGCSSRSSFYPLSSVSSSAWREETLEDVFWIGASLNGGVSSVCVSHRPTAPSFIFNQVSQKASPPLWFKSVWREITGVDSRIWASFLLLSAAYESTDSMWARGKGVEGQFTACRRKQKKQSLTGKKENWRKVGYI